jgi:hypothetical protein
MCLSNHEVWVSSFIQHAREVSPFNEIHCNTQDAAGKIVTSWENASHEKQRKVMNARRQQNIH